MQNHRSPRSRVLCLSPRFHQKVPNRRIFCVMRYASAKKSVIPSLRVEKGVLDVFRLPSRCRMIVLLPPHCLQRASVPPRLTAVGMLARPTALLDTLPSHRKALLMCGATRALRPGTAGRAPFLSTVTRLYGGMPCFQMLRYGLQCRHFSRNTA